MLTQEHMNVPGKSDAVNLGLAHPGRTEWDGKLAVCCHVLCGRSLAGRASCIPESPKGGRDLALGCGPARSLTSCPLL
ncbi:hypothetical protein QR98_0011860, partial [Sarcoptes scabiei]